MCLRAVLEPSALPAKNGPGCACRGPQNRRKSGLLSGKSRIAKNGRAALLNEAAAARECGNICMRRWGNDRRLKARESAATIRANQRHRLFVAGKIRFADG